MTRKVLDLKTGQMVDSDKQPLISIDQKPLTEEQASQMARSDLILDLKTGKMIPRGASIEDAIGKKRQLSTMESIGEMITGSRRKEANPEIHALPEFGATKEGGAVSEGGEIKNAIPMLTTSDNEELKDILLQNVEGIDFEDLDDGTVIVKVPDGKGGVKRSVLNRAGFSAQDFSTGVAEALAFLPVSKAAALGKGILQKFGIGLFGSAATEQARQELVIAQGSEQGRDPISTAITGATGGLSEVVAPMTQTIRNRAKVEQGKAEALATSQGIEAQEKTGINLFPAQKSLNPYDIETQSYLAQLPESSTIAMQRIDKQNKEVAQSVYNLINSIAPPESLSTAGEKLLNAADRAIEVKKMIRREKTSPLYNQAFATGADVDLSDVTNSIDIELDDLADSSQMSAALKKVKDLISGKESTGGIMTPPSLKKLHNAKIEIDNMINGQGDNAIGRTTEAALISIQKDLVTAMEDASPLYMAAKEEFAALSPSVDAIRNAVRVSELKSTDLKNVINKIFDTAETNPSIIANARKAIQEVDPRAWDYVVRAEIEKRLGKVRVNLGDVTNTPTPENVPSQIYNALFGNEKSRAILYRALSDEQKESFKYLETALKRASKGRQSGSQTAIRGEIAKEFKGGLFEPLRRLFREPIATISGVGEQVSFEQRAAILADTMFNPENASKVSRLKELDPRSQTARSIMRQMINVSIKSLPDDIASSFNDISENVETEQPAN